VKKLQLAPVRLGFEIPGGDAVEIPIRHTVIVGQTQESGKTTTLEALITRSGLRAVTFVTKRGEGSFTQARRIAPYFRDSAGDWQYVASILEASRGEKMKLERAFIIRASKGARSLKDVHANVKRLLADPKLRGMAADMYLCLDAYLEVVVPTIDSVRWATALELAAGVNAVDLTDVPAEMQHLVIQSSIDWVLAHEADTIVVIPEAWKFVPEGRKTPVKQSAVSLIRQGAALRNYVWLDSQDIGGISKEILRSCPVWLIGVQREANEIKRTLDNIPEGLAKPKKADIATLSIGQFYACWSTHAQKTYVQPAWMSAETAQHVAMGHAAAAAVRGDLLPPSVPPPSPSTFPDHIDRHGRHYIKEKLVNVAEANALKEENQQLRTENGDLRRRIEALERSPGAGHTSTQSRNGAAVAPGAHRADLARDERAPHSGAQATGASSVPQRTFSAQALDNEALYQAIKARLIAEGVGGRVLQVTPPEKLRLDFQQAEADRIVDAVRGVSPVARLVLKLLESLEGKRLSQRAIAERLGRAHGGWVGECVKDLGDLVHVDPKNGVAGGVRRKVVADLATYNPDDSAVEECVQAVLHVLATEE
jgi:hypothetical protein